MFESVLNTSVSIATQKPILHQTHSEFWHIQNSVYSGICWYNQAYLALLIHSRILIHYEGIFRHSHTLAISWTPNPGIVKFGGILKTLCNFDQAYSEPCHSQHSLFNHYSVIFRHMQNLRSAYICRNLAYSESWNIQNPSIIASRGIFRTISYLRKCVNLCNPTI